MSKKTLFWIGVVIVVVAIVFLTRGDDKGAVMASVKVTLDEQNDSGESGTVTITEFDGKVKVVGDLTGAPATTPQPAHIHIGPCATIGAVKYPLTSFVDGSSETVLDFAWADFEAMAKSQPLAINVHKSGTESSVYVACGDIEIEGAMMKK